MYRVCHIGIEVLHCDVITVLKMLEAAITHIIRNIDKENGKPLKDLPFEIIEINQPAELKLITIFESGRKKCPW